MLYFHYQPIKEIEMFEVYGVVTETVYDKFDTLAEAVAYCSDTAYGIDVKIIRNKGKHNVFIYNSKGQLV